MNALRTVTTYEIEVCKGGKVLGIATVRATTAYAACARAVYEAKRDGLGAVTCGTGRELSRETSTDSSPRVIRFESTPDASRCAVCGGLNPGDPTHARCM